ncbi:MAG: hypothetical protein AAFW73_19290 [Bacteroidota bacterium]
MKPLAEDYKNKLDEIAEALQNAEEYQQYLEEEEEEHYLALREKLEPQIASVYDRVAEHHPLQLVALEQYLLQEKFEGLFLPKILGFAVLRGEINEHYKYIRPQIHFQQILSAICQSSNFDLIKKRIGQTIQMGFALSSDIKITSLINTFENKKIRYFLQAQKLPRYRDPRERATGYVRYKNQFRKENFLSADFPTNATELKLLFSSLKHFLLYRIQRQYDNSNILPEIRNFLANDALKNTPEYLHILGLYTHFFEVTGEDQKTLKQQFNEMRRSFADFEEVWWQYVLGVEDYGVTIDGTADDRVFQVLDLDIDDNLTAYYRLMNVIHTQGYTHADSVEAMRNFYGNYPGLSDINEAARRTILRYIGNFLGNISVEDYSEYFELSKIFPIYTDLFGNQQFNQSLKAICLRYIKRLLKRFTDKRGKDYQDIKKFVNTSFIDLGFMKPKELVEMFKTKRKKKSTTA